MHARLAMVGALSALAITAAPSVASAYLGEPAIGSVDPMRLDVLEHGCFWYDRDVERSTHLDLTYLHEGEYVKELHITVDDDAPFSVDQVLVRSDQGGGYEVYDKFYPEGDRIHPGRTAVDLFAPDGPDYGKEPDRIDTRETVICVTDHQGPTNEPYIQLDRGNVAVPNRPIVQPTIAALGVSAIEPLNTYKVGFGYETERWQYGPDWQPGLNLFGDHVLVPFRADNGDKADPRAQNDIDEFGEQFNDPHSEKTAYGQPFVFHRNGDPYAYLHKSLPGTVDGGDGFFSDYLASLRELGADQTSAIGLFTFTAQGDLPLSWHVKTSLAPPWYKRSVTLTDDQLRAWEASWQAYYRGGPKPTLPLAPGTNSPAPRAVVVVNLPEHADGNGHQSVVTTSTSNTVVHGGCVSNRKVRITFHKKAKLGRVRVNGHTVKATRSGGRLRAVANLSGMRASSGSYATVVVREKVGGKWRSSVRLYKIC
jgi:hypothetical protein